jgi:hypothetical protein
MAELFAFLQRVFCPRPAAHYCPDYVPDLVGDFTHDYDHLEPTWADHADALASLDDPYVLGCGRSFIEHCWRISDD